MFTGFIHIMYKVYRDYGIVGFIYVGFISFCITCYVINRDLTRRLVLESSLMEYGILGFVYGLRNGGI